MDNYESTNINSLWLTNIFENLKNLEVMERISREGCNSLMDYLQIPLAQRQIILADTQYKNLKFMVTEMQLLLTDLSPVVAKDKHKAFMDTLKKIQPPIHIRRLFLVERHSVMKNGIFTSEVTPFFYETLTFLSELKLDIIKEISHILYIKDDGGNNKPKW